MTTALDYVDKFSELILATSRAGLRTHIRSWDPFQDNLMSSYHRPRC